jgi:RNA-binding protein
MPAPTNPKKRSLMPSTKLRKALRAAGHHLSPVVQIGKEGLTDAVLRALDEQLLAHELVKLKVGTESPGDRFEIAERVGEAAGAQVAQVLGRTVLVYRKHPEKPRFEPAPAGAAARAAKKGGAEREDAPRRRRGADARARRTRPRPSGRSRR